MLKNTLVATDGSEHADPTRSSIDARRDQLQRRADQLRRELYAAGQPGLRPDAGAAAEVEDQKDRASRSEAWRVRDAEEQRDLDELAQVSAALARIEAGSYGHCAECGEPIGELRLAAMPAAECCAACQAERERHPAGAARHG